eukprot:g70894.t1
MQLLAIKMSPLTRTRIHSPTHDTEQPQHSESEQQDELSLEQSLQDDSYKQVSIGPTPNSDFTAPDADYTDPNQYVEGKPPPKGLTWEQSDSQDVQKHVTRHWGISTDSLDSSSTFKEIPLVPSPALVLISLNELLAYYMMEAMVSFPTLHSSSGLNTINPAGNMTIVKSEY